MDKSRPNLADEITAVRAVIDDMLMVKAHCRTPKYESTIEAMHAVLRRLIAIEGEMENEVS